MSLAARLQHLGTETAFAVSAEAARCAEDGQHIYPFHLGDINLPTPSNIIEAAHRAMRDGKTGYCAAAGIQPLREALAQDVGRRREVDYGPDNVSVQPGGKPTIGKFLSVVMNPGDEVLYPNPGYPIYESQIEFLGGAAVPYCYVAGDAGLAIDLDQLKASITAKTKTLILNDCQNPTAAECSPAEREAIAELAQRHDLWVLSDEAYFEMRYEGERHSIASLPGMQQRTVILYTFSKKFAMTGWRLGGAIGPQVIIEHINRLNVNAESCSPHFLQWAGVEALTGDSGGAEAILAVLKQRRDAAVAALQRIDGIRIATPRSTFYLFPEVTDIVQKRGLSSAEELRSECLSQTGVSFCSRSHFGRPLPSEKSHFIRLAYSGIAEKEIEEGLGTLKEYLERPP